MSTQDGRRLTLRVGGEPPPLGFRPMSGMHDHDPGDEEHAHDSERNQAPPREATSVGTVHDIEQRILAKNDALADRNRVWLESRRILTLNLMSSPGSGKTTLLVRTLLELGGDLAVIEGDQASERDAARIRSTGISVVQVNTGTGCHLEADMVWEGIRSLEPAAGSTLFVENVGNLVCPALFDLGERARVVLFSITEGEDKPLKYPHMFRAADIVLITKTDLLPHLQFDMGEAVTAVHDVNPDAQILQTSAMTGEGMDDWYDWIRARRPAREAS